jgi:hypothetical protein
MPVGLAAMGGAGACAAALEMVVAIFNEAPAEHTVMNTNATMLSLK